MLTSMTGFGYGYAHEGDLGIAVEIKSVNHRYLDLFFRLPKELQKWEEKMRAGIKKQIVRGRIETKLTVESMPEESYTVRVNRPLVKAYQEAIKEIKGALALSDELELSHFLRFPDIIILQESLDEDERLARLIGDSLDKALQHLVSQRREEGINLRKDLLERCSRIEQYIEAAEARAPVVIENYRDRLQKKMKELEGGILEEGRVITECTIFAERCDITEELVRLQSHMQFFKEALNATEAVGRKLDFILQEMSREINTIGSKGNDKQLSLLVVDAKTELEKMREQVQNIE